MILPIFVGRRWGALRASFDPHTGFQLFDMVVPGGSELLETKAFGHTVKVLYVPTSDPSQRMAWSAAQIFIEAKKGFSRFRIVWPRMGSSRQG